MVLITHFAITDLPLEFAEVLLIVALVWAAVATARYIRRLRATLNKVQKELDDQSRFAKTLNDTVDRMLKIERQGGIDSNRRHRK